MKLAGAAKRERRRGAPSAPPRVVLDTNVVLSALLFGSGPAARVRAGWQAGLFIPMASRPTAHELVRLLAYPKFKLSAAEQHELLADVMPWMQVVRVPVPPPTVPACRDPHDLPFLQLAVAGKAKALVSGDRDLLSLSGARAVCPLLSVEAFCRQYLE